jgi:hypothetical protein
MTSLHFEFEFQIVFTVVIALAAAATGWGLVRESLRRRTKPEDSPGREDDSAS